ncbi:hypothetical protein CC99x_005435 [Candidatus Berkiella cookevillensis]|uniref:Uncharacterized protein n=1 Tax=Candidatus Berkiella cookevillensis TaxID=437022 RepID=A0A0Q9YTB0_9GAMM|nr:hypothetical protein [Candidatus Berkiella cookevillensis]MCS5708344.1 hypothetical protein [Candidatus Berkiella cookevillensis]
MFELSLQQTTEVSGGACLTDSNCVHPKSMKLMKIILASTTLVGTIGYYVAGYEFALLTSALGYLYTTYFDISFASDPSYCIQQDSEGNYYALKV